MSLALLRKSFEILDPAKSSENTTAKNKTSNMLGQGSKRRRKHTTDLAGGAVQQSKLHDIRRDLEQNSRKMNENLCRLLTLSKNAVKITDAEKIVKRAHQGHYVDVELKNSEPQSIFTDEDFRAFEEQYLNA